MLKNLKQTDTNSPHPTTQSGPDSQTAQRQARNTASGCNAIPSRGLYTGFTGGRVAEGWISEGLEFQTAFGVVKS